MAKLPSSFRERNQTSRNFRDQYALLPELVQLAVREACKLFDSNPAHPSLRHHRLKDTKQSKHPVDSYSVSPTMQYRALYTVRGGINVWFWIGTHADYKGYTDSPR
jgi:hypothetical protein